MIKKFKTFITESYLDETSDTIDVFNSYINWNMIFDIKDMSLEYIDEGAVLRIIIIYEGEPAEMDHFLLVIDYDHETKSITEDNWNTIDDPYDFEPIDKNRIKYEFNLSISVNKFSEYERAGKSIKLTEENKELEIRIKEAYPDLNIKHDNI